MHATQVVCAEDEPPLRDAPDAEAVSEASLSAYKSHILAAALNTDTKVSSFYLEQAGGDLREARDLYRACPLPPAWSGSVVVHVVIVCHALCPQCLYQWERADRSAALVSAKFELAAVRFVCACRARPGLGVVWGGPGAASGVSGPQVPSVARAVRRVHARDGDCAPCGARLIMSAMADETCFACGRLSLPWRWGGCNDVNSERVCDVVVRGLYARRCAVGNG